MSLATNLERLEPPDGAGLLDTLVVDPEPASCWDIDISEERIKGAKIMIVDDEILNVHVFRKHLESTGYHRFVTTSDATQALPMIGMELPDVILLDLVMPVLNGLQILEALKADRRLRRIPVIMLTASHDAENRQRALELNVADFLNKPVGYHELVLRVRNALLVKTYQDRLADHARHLEAEVRRRTADLDASRKEVILCLARAGEFRDSDTGNHVIRVGKYASMIARELGFSEQRVDILEQAARLHDVGKIAIPDEILHKPGRLTPEEFEVVQKHCVLGQNIMQQLSQRDWERLKKHGELGAQLMDVRSSPILRLASVIALTHHERWDGTGYPLGLAGEDIPVEGRMTAVADVFDTLTTRRPYKPPFPRQKAFDILEEGRAKQFDPRMLDAFFRRHQEILQVQIDCADLM